MLNTRARDLQLFLFDGHFQAHHSNFDEIIHNLINIMNQGEFGEFIQQFENLTQALESSDDVLADSSGFLQNFIHSVNACFGTSLTLSEVLHYTRECLVRLPISNEDAQGCLLGVDLIALHQLPDFYFDQPGFVNLAGHHKRSTGLWAWLCVATVTAGAIVITLISPATGPKAIDIIAQVLNLLTSENK